MPWPSDAPAFGSASARVLWRVNATNHSISSDLRRDEHTADALTQHQTCTHMHNTRGGTWDTRDKGSTGRKLWDTRVLKSSGSDLPPCSLQPLVRLLQRCGGCCGCCGCCCCPSVHACNPCTIHFFLLCGVLLLPISISPSYTYVTRTCMSIQVSVNHVSNPICRKSSTLWTSHEPPIQMCTAGFGAGADQPNTEPMQASKPNIHEKKEDVLVMSAGICV